MQNFGTLQFRSHGKLYSIDFDDRASFKLAIHALHIFISQQNIPIKVKLEIEKKKDEMRDNER